MSRQGGISAAAGGQIKPRRHRRLTLWSIRRLGFLLIAVTAVGLAVGLAAAHWHFAGVERALVTRSLLAAQDALGAQRRAAEALGRRTSKFIASTATPSADRLPATMMQLRDRLSTESGLSWVALFDSQRSLQIAMGVDGAHIDLNAEIQAALLAALADQGAVDPVSDAFFLLLDNRPVLISQAELTLPDEGPYLILVAQPVANPRVSLADGDAAVAWRLQSRAVGSPAERVVSTNDLRWEARDRLRGSTLDIVVSQSPQFSRQEWLVGLALGLWSILAVTLVLMLFRKAFKAKVSARLNALVAATAIDMPRPEHGAPREPGDEIDQLKTLITALLADRQTQWQDKRLAVESDSLTGLGNRTALLAALNYVSDREPATGGLAARTLVMIDIGDFTLLNDGVGRLVGDRILLEFADRIARAIGPHDMAARTGADEFCVLLSASPEEAVSFCELLRLSLAVPIQTGAHQFALRVSMGMAEQRAEEDADQWLRNAEMATQSAKRRGASHAVPFDPALRTLAQTRLSMEQDLRKAIEARTIETWFQPIVDGRTGAVVGLEALARWRLQEEYVSPAEFIAIAESTGMIVRLGQIVLSSTCEMLARLRKVYPGLTCSLNLSVRQFIEGDLLHDLSTALERHGLPPSAIPLEVTESQVAAHEAQVLEQMNALADRGMRFYLDDFGVGLSSLGRLRSLPVHTLKIDRSFVEPLEYFDDPMVGHIVALAHDLGLRTIAEGVETENARARLVQLGCCDMQGYLLSRPMTEGALWPWLEHRVVGSSSIAA